MTFEPFVGLQTTSAVAMTLSGMGTVLGALGLLVLRRPGTRMRAALLGFTGGIMLAASAFSLLVPAFERGTIVEIVVGFGLGVVTLTALDSLVPHVHSRFREEGIDYEHAPAERRGILLVSALTIHNVPEGMAVGVAFAAGGPELGLPVAIAIGIQNIPEGFAAGAPLLETPRPKLVSAAIAGATGLVEIPAAFAAYALTDLISELLPGGLAFAAGAMIYVVVDELIPESHVDRHERTASLSLLGGFALMMVLDNAFG